jgi:hypothetical protein
MEMQLEIRRNIPKVKLGAIFTNAAAAKGYNSDYESYVVKTGPLGWVGGLVNILKPSDALATHVAVNDTAEAKATHEIGAIESTGEHKGEIYGGIYPADNKPIWFSAAPKLMDHYAAAAWAQGHGGSLPTRKQGDYLTTLKGKGGAFTEIFNRGGSFPAGCVWLAKPLTFNRNNAWCQELRSGDQSNFYRYLELPVLSVRR